MPRCRSPYPSLPQHQDTIPHAVNLSLTLLKMGKILHETCWANLGDQQIVTVACSYFTYELHAVSIWFVNRASPYRKMLLRHEAPEQIRIQKSFYWKRGGSFNRTIDPKQQQLSVNSLPSIKVTSTLNTPLQVVLQHWTSDPQLSSSSMQHHYKHMRLNSFRVGQ